MIQRTSHYVKLQERHNSNFQGVEEITPRSSQSDACRQMEKLLTEPPTATLFAHLSPPVVLTCLFLGFHTIGGAEGLRRRETDIINMMAAASLLCVRVTARYKTPQACCRMPGMASGSQRHESPTLNKQSCSCPRPWPPSRCRLKMEQRQGEEEGQGPSDMYTALQWRGMLPGGLFSWCGVKIVQTILWDVFFKILNVNLKETMCKGKWSKTLKKNWEMQLFCDTNKIASLSLMDLNNIFLTWPKINFRNSLYTVGQFMLQKPSESWIKAEPCHTVLHFLRGRSQWARKIASFCTSLLGQHQSIGSQPAEARRPCKHLPTRQLCGPEPAGPQLLVSGRKSQLDIIHQGRTNIPSQWPT